MKLTALILALTAVVSLHARNIIPNQNILLDDVVGSTYGGAWVQYDVGSVTVKLGEIATPHPIYDGVGWVVQVGLVSHLLYPLDWNGLDWSGTFSIPAELQYSPAQYFLTITFAGYAGIDVNDTFVTYRSEPFLLFDAPPFVPDPIVPPEDPDNYPPNVPEPGAWAMLAAIGLLGFAGYRRIA